jgi:hypothetical protein
LVWQEFWFNFENLMKIEGKIHEVFMRSKKWLGKFLWKRPSNFRERRKHILQQQQNGLFLEEEI